MTAPSGKQYPVGLRHARVYALDTNGFIAATSTTVYEGLQISASKAYELNVPDARRIVHTGDDKIQAQDVLPSLEASTGTLRVGRNDHDVHALLTATKAFTIGEAKGIGYLTDKQGSEPTIAALLYQQSLDAISKVRKWRSYILPATQAIVNPSSMNENAPEFTYNLLPQVSTRHPWGIAYTTAVEGFTETRQEEFMTDNIPHIVAWKADGSATEFLFDTDRPAVSTAKIHAVVTCEADGTVTDVTGTATLATDKVTVAGPLDSGTIVACFYEYAA